MAVKLKEANKIDALRNKLIELSEIITVGKSTKDYMAKHPVGSVAGLVVIGLLITVVSGNILRLLFRLASFGLKIAAFVFVTRQTLSNISKFFGKKA
ncbi:MAG: hypothetical protein A2Y25_06890 [Candidatus Melainabacteria bacterium GWF2_37_15]|nr:MAG: hypothetical protein A2Y25_06890 [Candidatus Melainabacteria bacterium GWF2_37_15]